MSERARYSDEQKAEALAALDANGGNVSKTARELGIKRTVLQQWKTRGVPTSVTQMSHEKKAPLADRLDALAHTLLDDLEMVDARSGTINNRAVALAIAVDKARLLRGEPTTINENRNLEAARESVAKKLERIASIPAQPTAQA